MGKQRYKQIRAGRLVREALWTAAFPLDSPKARAFKAKCSSAARQRLNDKLSWQKLKMALAANFTYEDLVVTLTYDDAHLPESRAAAGKLLKKFLVQLRAYRRARGGSLSYIYCTEDKHGDGRLHHHLVINGTGEDYPIIYSLWPYGTDLCFEPLDIYGYEELAKYLTKEPREYGHTNVGARTWVPSLNLRKPEVMPAQWVPETVRLAPPPNAYMLRADSFQNEWCSYSYIEYLLPEPPKNARTRPKNKPNRNP